MVTAHEELELKYDVDEGVEVPALAALLAQGGAAGDPASPLSEGDGGEHELEAVYFDTADLQLAAARTTLRRRTGGEDAGWHVKLPGDGGAGGGAGGDAEVRERRELRVPLGRAVRTVPAALRRLVAAQTGDAPLVPVARISTTRRVRHLVDPTGRVLLELADDRVTAQRLLPSDGPGDVAAAPVSWREVEVELVDGDRALLGAVAAGARAAGLRPSASGSKLARALGTAGPGVPAQEDPAQEDPAQEDPAQEEPAQEEPAGDEPAGGTTGAGAPAQPGPLPRPRGKLTTRSRAGDVVLAHLVEQVEQVLAQDPRVRLDAPDAVHKMRVATRRLRSALRTFQPLFAEPTRPLRDELRWLAAELGAARDAEVLRDRLSGAVAELTPADAPAAPGDGGTAEVGEDAPPPAARAVREQLEGAYREAHDRVLAELDSERYRRLLQDLRAFVTGAPLTARAERPAGKVLPRRVARTYEQLAELVRRAQRAEPGHERDELLHEARKAAKQVRYAAEAVAVVFGKDATRFARAVTEVQEVLGEHQDSVVTRERLHDLATAEGVGTAAAFAYGRLYERELVHAAASEEDFAAVWAAAGTKRLHRWLR